MRPKWFLHLAEELYCNPMPEGLIESKDIRIKAFLCLIILFIVDIASVPVTPAIAFVIILSRPQWFLRVIRGVYNDVA